MGKVISTHTLSTTWRTSTDAYFLYQNGDSTYYKGELAGYISSMSSQIAAKANIAQSTWINVIYSSNWVNYSTTYPPTSYFKDTLGFVHFRLNARTGASNPVCILPAGYVPQYNLVWNIISNPTSTVGPSVTITSSGGCTVLNHSNGYIILGEIIYTPST